MYGSDSKAHRLPVSPCIGIARPSNCFWPYRLLAAEMRPVSMCAEGRLLLFRHQRRLLNTFSCFQSLAFLASNRFQIKFAEACLGHGLRHVIQTVSATSEMPFQSRSIKTQAVSLCQMTVGALSCNFVWKQCATQRFVFTWQQKDYYVGTALPPLTKSGKETIIYMYPLLATDEHCLASDPTSYAILRAPSRLLKQLQCVRGHQGHK